MKIIRLQSSNILRLVAVNITPQGDLVIVGGKNGAGKSSVLNSIAMALGGATMCPQEPIRAGEHEAKIVVDLGDLVVTRRFSRTFLHAEGCGNGLDVTTSETPKAEQPKLLRCKCNTFGETTSTLVVTNKDGARYPSPQALLDKLLGKLTFDPLAFSRDDPKRQDATLRALVGLDVSAIEARRKAAFDQRARLKKSLAIKEAQLAALPKHDSVPDAEISMAEVSAEMLKAEELRKAADAAKQDVDKAKDAIGSTQTAVEVNRAKLDQLQRQMNAIQEQFVRYETQLSKQEKDLSVRRNAADAAIAAVPNVAIIRARLVEVEATNVKVRANQTHAKAKAEIDSYAAVVEQEHKAVAAAEQEKANALKAVAFPVPGLGLSDDGITFGGLPFSQASSSEQLRVSVAIGLALNPTLKVLLIRSGNLLDDDSLKLVAAQAEEAGAQIWIEWVTANAEGVSVMIEDGRVADAGH